MKALTLNVVHVRDVSFADWNSGAVVYIGRANSRYHLNASKWANPFAIGRDGTRAEVIAKYLLHVTNSPELKEALPELRGKTLACWCAPEACHGDVLALLAAALPPEGHEG